MTGAQAQSESATERQNRTQQPRAWNVVLLDDQDHTYEYVIRMM